MNVWYYIIERKTENIIQLNMIVFVMCSETEGIDKCEERGRGMIETVCVP